MKASIKQSRTTKKQIVVLGGTEKCGEVVGNDIKITMKLTAGNRQLVETLAAKKSLTIEGKKFPY